MTIQELGLEMRERARKCRMKAMKVALTADELEALLDAIPGCKDDPVGRETQAKLTVREAQIVRLVARGMANRKIAAELRLTPQVVKNYLSRIFDKTGTNSRFELLAFSHAHLALLGEDRP